MKIINDVGFPEHAFKAICLRQGRLEPPKLDYIGVSTLIGAPLPRYLYARYWHQLEVKASETMNALQGQLGHLLFDKVETETMKEVHLSTDFEGTRLYGIMDYYDPKIKTLGDAKFQQVNSVTAGNISKDDYLEKQLNIYCWMARRKGLVVEHLQGDIYINGWVRYKAMAEGNYPKAPYQKILLPIWEENFTANYVRDRIKAHDTKAIQALRVIGPENIPILNEAILLDLDALMLHIPICTDKERFAQPTRYAVMREGQKKAVKLFDRRAEAESFIAGQGDAAAKKMSIAERKGGYIKCKFYCDVRGFCVHNKEKLDND